MCGIVGLFDSRGRREIDRGLLVRMNESLRHRGPDGEGVHIAEGIGLGHRRLAIIDLSGGHQPMFNEDGTVAVVFNGEIYNFVELKSELVTCGHRFRTHSDTEVIVHAWEEWGRDCVSRFRGMFAFALWDEGAETLFLARDRLGKKPLYYAALADGTVLFGSELKALRLHPDLPLELDDQAVEDYLAYGYVPDPRSIYRAVAKLPPAHTLVWRRGRDADVEPYWDLTMASDGPATMEAAGEELRGGLGDAVKARLISDVPLGAFLSGGVDSSSVVSLMAEQSNAPTRTFAIGFGERAFDESSYAREVAELYRTQHTARQVDPNDFSLVDRLADVYDEPFGDVSAIPTYRLCAATREHVTVALSGDGGDELLAGYRRYLWHTREQAVRARLPRALRAKTTFKELSLDEDEAFFNSVSITPDAMRRRLYSGDFRRRLNGYHAIDVLRRQFDRAGTDDPLLRAQYADIKTYLPGDILTKVDRASMASSLEVRAPMLDHHFAEWTARLRPPLKLHRGVGKRVLKRAFESRLPNHILYRPKQGFTVPLASWFRGPLREEMRALATGPAVDSGYFDRAAVTRLVDQHVSGRFDHSAVLWLLVMFGSFVQRHH